MRSLTLAVSAIVLTADLSLAASLPPWAREVVASSGTSDRVAALVLLDQIDVTVTADGKVRTTRRYAVRVQDRGGRDAAALREVYVTGTGKVKEIRGWLIRAAGDVRELGNRDAIDVALVNNDVYNEVRVRTISAIDAVAPGDVFAAEVESEDRLLVSQLEWQMQDRWPTRRARRTLTLVPGWRASSVTFNAPPLEPRREGAALVWEMADLPALPDEAAMPPDTALAPRVAVSFFGPAALDPPGQFETWGHVSAWLYALSDSSSRSSELVAAKARELTASAGNAFDRVAAIARYVQRVQYVSIQTGLGRGGGYQPRPASLVLERNYGDCKDKASLMRAMLGSIGIESHLVSLFSGDRSYVRAEWPSPQQFNHAIIAVSLPNLPPDVSSVVDHPDLGRLLMFDPTDEHTPFGGLPLDDQGSLVLVVHPSSGRLVRMPLTPASDHAVRRVTQGAIGANGMLTATIQEHFTGTLAAAARARRTALDDVAYRASIERLMTPALPRVHVVSADAKEDVSQRAFTVTSQVQASGYFRADDGLAMFAPPFELGGRIEMPTAKDRKTAVQLEPRLVSETMRLQIPAGFVVDEQPARVSLDTPFGRYTLEYLAGEGYLEARRSLETPLQAIRPEELSAARAFFEQVRAADAALVVLARQPRE